MKEERFNQLCEGIEQAIHIMTGDPEVYAEPIFPKRELDKLKENGATLNQVLEFFGIETVDNDNGKKTLFYDLTGSYTTYADGPFTAHEVWDWLETHSKKLNKYNPRI